MQKVIINFLRLVFALLYASTAMGQPLSPHKELSQYNLDHFRDDGIPSGITQMVQTRDGYLWMATYKSLVRFDGIRVTVYDKFTTPSIQANGFKCLYEDRHNNLWAGSNGDGLLLKRGNSFKTFSIPFGASSNNIENIFCDSHDNLWLGTIKGLVQFKDSVFTLIPLEGSSAETEFTVYDLAEDKDNTVWIASSIGVLKYSNGVLTKQVWEGDSLHGEVSTILFDAGQNMWIGSYGSGIFKLQGKELTKVSALSNFTRITSIIEDSQRNIWIISENGVARVNKYGISTLGSAQGLSHDNVTAICEDHEGSMWLGTYYGGMDRLRDGSFTNYTKENGLPHNTIHSIFQTHDSTLWVGTESNIAYFKNGKFTTLPYAELLHARVRDIRSDSENNLWIATYSGLYKIKDNVLTKYTTSQGLASNQVRIVYEDSNKRLWIGTRNGLNVLDRETWKTYREGDGLLNGFIMSVLELHNGTIVVGTTSGLYQLNGERFSAFTSDKGETLGLTFRMYEDEDHTLWVGTSGGLVCFQGKTLHSFANDHRQLAGNIYQIIEDTLGMFWLPSDAGIIRVSKKNLLERLKNKNTVLAPQLFDKSNGLRTNEVTATSSGLLSLDKKIWFPTLGGVSMVDPANILINKVPPPLAIEKVLVSGKEYMPGETIQIPYSSKNIEIHYSALSYMIPHKVQYKYKLEGYDDEWHEVGDRRVAFYTSLAPGEYTFKIAASNNDGVWNSEEKAVVFYIEKAFWQSWIFYTMASLVVGLTIFGIVDYRIRSIKRLNRILDDRIKERTHQVLQQKEEIESQRDYIEAKHNELEKARNLIAEQYEKLREVNETLEEKVNERTQALKKAYEDLVQANEELDYFVYKSAHDIKGPLARLQGLCNLALMEAPDETSKNYLSILQKESVLANRLIQKLSHAHEIKSMELEISAVNLNDLIYEIINQLGNSHPEAAHVTFRVDVDRNSILHTDIRLLRELLFNLLENAVVFQSDHNQQVEIRSVRDYEMIKITIDDNGAGIDEKLKGEIFKMFVKGSEKSVGLGLGLYITRQATDKLHGSVTLQKTNGSGTKFEIRLPIRIMNIPERKIPDFLAG